MTVFLFSKAEKGGLACVQKQTEACTIEDSPSPDAFIGAHLSGLLRVNEKKEGGPRTLRDWNADHALSFLQHVEYDGAGHLVVSRPGIYRIKSHLGYCLPLGSNGTQATHHIVRFDATSHTEAILQSATVSSSPCQSLPCDGYSDLTVQEILHTGDMVYIQFTDSLILGPRKSDSYFELISL
ncbi:uncharacterized protein LOC124286318 [Haliotis rubra]|uniref:uncharacterized protein LOC124286318 n=1 Tax=Haliotis rubra TaxID=36100 RepID=UPI001EE51C5D|nr:uncharacterized protein LOC124286318 [Haliotis rubra]